ncbi:MAG: NUDIX domain-containing protein, partial [Burkholderiaceae bacterium]
MTAAISAERIVGDRAPVDVAVGILIRPDGRLLLASRPAGKPYAGYWEFPGGKLEAGETVAHALARELHEELGVDIGPVFPWLVREFDYPHALVRLHFCRVFEWRGVLHAREQQGFGFYPLDALPRPLLPATVPVLRGLELPAVYAISGAHVLGVKVFLRRLEAALASGLRFVQLREPQLG